MLRTDRKFIVILLLSVITFGIYGLYLYHKMAQEANIVDAPGKRVGGLAALIFFSIITFGIYSLYWNYRICEKFGSVVRTLTGQQPRITGGGWLLWSILGAFIIVGPLVAAVKQIHLWNDANFLYNSRLA